LASEASLPSRLNAEFIERREVKKRANAQIIRGTEQMNLKITVQLLCVYNYNVYNNIQLAHTVMFDVIVKFYSYKMREIWNCSLRL
jgi:hypothetical protein